MIKTDYMSPEDHIIYSMLTSMDDYSMEAIQKQVKKSTGINLNPRYVDKMSAKISEDPNYGAWVAKYEQHKEFNKQVNTPSPYEQRRMATQKARDAEDAALEQMYNDLHQPEYNDPVEAMKAAHRAQFGDNEMNQAGKPKGQLGKPHSLKEDEREFYISQGATNDHGIAFAKEYGEKLDGSALTDEEKQYLASL